QVANGSGSPGSPNGDLQIGADCRPPGSSGCFIFFPGQVDEVRLTNGVRYTTNFTPPRRLKTESNTVAMWHLDIGGPNVTFDSSPNNITATLTNGPANSPPTDGVTNGPL